MPASAVESSVSRKIDTKFLLNFFVSAAYADLMKMELELLTSVCICFMRKNSCSLHTLSFHQKMK